MFSSPSSSESCMKLASCPDPGLCLSHAPLDPRHFIALTSPPTVTAALNEAAHMCSDQVGQESPGIQLNVSAWTCLTNRYNTGLFFFKALYRIHQRWARMRSLFSCFLLGLKSVGPATQSEAGPARAYRPGTMAMPSLTTVRIKGHNGGRCRLKASIGQATGSCRGGLSSDVKFCPPTNPYQSSVKGHLSKLT